MGVSLQILNFRSPSQESTDLTSAPVLSVNVPYVTASIESLPQALEALGLTQRTPVLVVIGGASQISPEDFDRIRQLFQEVLAPIAQQVGATVIDGGTHAGIMQLMGEARSSLEYQFPLLGIAPVHLTCMPGESSHSEDITPLESHHTHFIGVPGNEWGDESQILARTATAIASGSPSVAIVINGGAVTLLDEQYNAAEGRELWVIAGTGRNADRLSAALQGDQSDPQLVALVETGLVKGYSLDQPNLLKEALIKFLRVDGHDQPIRT